MNELKDELELAHFRGWTNKDEEYIKYAVQEKVDRLMKIIQEQNK